MKKNEIEKAIRMEFLLHFEKIGFTGKINRPLFVKNCDGGKIQVSTTLNTLGRFPSVEYYIGLQVDEVETVLNEIIPPDPNLKISFFYTLNFPWHIFLRENHKIPENFERCEIQGDDYFSIITKEFLDLYLSRIQPFLLKNLEPSALSNLLNEEPLEDSPYTTQKVERAIRGLIAGYISTPNKTNDLITGYQKYLEKLLPQLKSKFDIVAKGLSNMTK